MGLLISGDLNEVGIERCLEAGGLELLLSVVCKTLTVEGILEVLKGKSIVEDVDWMIMLGMLNEKGMDKGGRTVSDGLLGQHWAGRGNGSKSRNTD